jgi:hypothetical protein
MTKYVLVWLRHLKIFDLSFLLSQVFVALLRSGCRSGFSRWSYTYGLAFTTSNFNLPFLDKLNLGSLPLSKQNLHVVCFERLRDGVRWTLRLADPLFIFSLLPFIPSSSSHVPKYSAIGIFLNRLRFRDLIVYIYVDNTERTFTSKTARLLSSVKWYIERNQRLSFYHLELTANPRPTWPPRTARCAAVSWLRSSPYARPCTTWESSAGALRQTRTQTTHYRIWQVEPNVSWLKRLKDCCVWSKRRSTKPQRLTCL